MVLGLLGVNKNILSRRELFVVTALIARDELRRYKKNMLGQLFLRKTHIYIAISYGKNVSTSVGK